MATFASFRHCQTQENANLVAKFSARSSTSIRVGRSIVIRCTLPDNFKSVFSSDFSSLQGIRRPNQSARRSQNLGVPEMYTQAYGSEDVGISTSILNFPNTFDPYGALSTPLYQTATFKQPSATENGPYDYTRSGNPTRTVLESLLAKLEGADKAFCFNSGMAALSTVTHLARAGDEIVTGDDIYGGSDRLLSQVAPRAGLIVKRVDTTNLQEVGSTIGSKTKIVWLESPTNPRLMVSNIREITRIAHQHGALVMADNSIMSPVLSKPLELGADIVMHSATKFISGHSDLMAGVLAVKGERLAKDIYFLQNAEGTGLAPFDCWLCLRGIKTMALRVEKQQV
ncbi:hypothetical protein L7F22_005498 [Adiantum nelumboides]|nr:hypothetical protein [Adiantum nelumboides]